MCRSPAASAGGREQDYLEEQVSVRLRRVKWTQFLFLQISPKGNIGSQGQYAGFCFHFPQVAGYAQWPMASRNKNDTGQQELTCQ
jgi:hypothetical protein